MKCANCGKQKNILCVCGFCQDCIKRQGHDALFKIQQKRKKPERWERWHDYLFKEKEPEKEKVKE